MIADPVTFLLGVVVIILFTRVGNLVHKEHGYDPSTAVAATILYMAVILVIGVVFGYNLHI